MPETIPHKRGAPLGNQNRRIHGNYARQPAPNSGLPIIPNRLTLDQEISILRAYIQRIALAGAAYADLASNVSTLRAISVAAVALSRLVQAGGWLNSSTRAWDLHDTLDEILAALEEACKGYEDPLSASL